MKEVTYGEFHIPLVYLGKKSGSNAELVIVDIKGSTVLYSYRSDETCRVGMIRTSKLEHSKGKLFFTVRGKKIKIPARPYGWVM